MSEELIQKNLVEAPKRWVTGISIILVQQRLKL